MYVKSISVTYADVAPAYTITAQSNNNSYGTVSLTGTTITATPAAGYRVMAGTGGYTVTVGTATVTNNGDNTFTVTPSSNCTVRINFESKGCTEHYGTNVISGSSADDDYGPVCAYNNYSTRQILYTRTDLGLAAGKKGTIKSIYFEYAGAAAMAARTIKIYMANTALTALSTSAFVPYSSFSEVYSGTFSCASAGWYEITLDTPFDYNGFGNLVVLIDDNTDSWESSKNFKYHTANTTTGAQIYYNNDGSNENPATTDWSTYTATNNRPNTKFCIQEADMAPATVTLMDNGATITEVSAGAGVTLPSRAGCAGYTFAGWTKTWVAPQSSWTTTAPTIIPAGSYTPSADENLYPVYTKTEGGDVGFARYSQISLGGSITSGKYLISTGTYTMSGSGNSGTSFSPGTTEKTNYEYTVTVSGDYFTIKGPDDNYVGGANSTSLTFSSSISDDTYRWKYVSTGIQNKTNNTRHIKAFNTTDFRHYASSNGTLTYLYKRIEESSSTTSYISVPNCCTPLGQINGSVSWSNGQATVSWDKLSGVRASTPYAVSVSPSAGVTVNSIDLTGAKATCSVTGLTAGTAYTFTINAYGDASHCDKNQAIPSTAPQITVKSAPVALTGSDYAEGVLGGGTVKTFTVSGVGLTDALTFTAPTNFQVSTDNGSTWSTSGGSKTLAASGTLAETTIKARLVEGLSVGTYGGATTYITISGGGAAAVNSSVSITGTVSSACSVPTIGNPTLTSITGTTITVSCPTISGGTNCDVDEYGFIWKAGSAPTMASYDGKKKTGENNQSTAYNDGLSIDVANNTGTTYYIKAYAHNSAGNNVSSTALQVTPRSVAFNMNGHGSQVATQYVNNGSKASEPSAPSASYYTFNGWKLSGSAYNFSTATVTSDITLDADWSVIPVTALTLNYSTLKRYVGESDVTLSVSSVTPNTANPAVTWTSSDATVASVDGGVVSFLKAGTATITATSTISGGVTATCSVEVRSISSPTMQDETGAAISTGVNKPSVTWTLGTRTLTANEETSNYKFKRWVVTNATPASTTNLSTTLGDPTGNVTVVAEFYKPRTVTKGTGTGTGTFTISASEVKYNSSVTVTCAPDASHKNPWTITITPADGATVASSTGSSGSITVSNITKNITIDLEYTDKGCTDHGASSITTGTDHNNYQAPINNNWKYGVRQILYTKEDLSLTTGKKGTIKSISFKYNYSSAMTKKDNVKIYMANTTLSSLSNTAGNYVPFSEFTEVYSGSLNCSTGWNEFILTTPFVYYSNKNLVVLIDDNSGDYDGSSYDFYVHSASGKQLYNTNDGSHLDPASAATWTGGTAADYRPHTDFCLQEGDMSQYTVTWHVGESTSTTSNVYEGTTFSSLSGSQPAHADNALAACGSTKFIGWVKAAGAYTDDGKTATWYDTHKYSPSDQINDDVDIYAMYAEGDVTDNVYAMHNGTSLNSNWEANTRGQKATKLTANTWQMYGYSNVSNPDGTLTTTGTYTNISSIVVEAATGDNTTTLKLYYSADKSSWTEASSYSISKNKDSFSDYELDVSDVPSTAVYIRLDNGTSSLYVKTVTISTGLYSNYRTGCTVSCGAPVLSSVTGISANGATIGWTDDGKAGTLDHYEYAVWVDGEDEPTSGFVNNGTTKNKALTGLLSNTDYNYKVRRVCTGDDNSRWSSGSFTTGNVSLTFSVPTGASAVAGQNSNVALPTAEVPTDCGDCWAFAGWTTAEYAESSSAPAKLFAAGDIVHLASADGSTMYAVYKKDLFELVEATTGLVNNNYYVLTTTDSGKEYAMSNVLSTTYATSVEVTDKAIERGSVYYIANPSEDLIWKFTGSASSGRLYNEMAAKYLDLSGDAILKDATTDNLVFTLPDPENDSSFDIASESETSNYLYIFSSYSSHHWGIDGSHSIGTDVSAYMYQRIECTYATSPNCPKYTVTWDINNGATTSTTDVTKCEGYLSALPSAPADNTLSGCQTNGKFMGWSASKVMPAQDIAPADIFSEVEDAPEITENVTFYAVFANGVAGAETPVNTTYTFNSKSWGDATNSWSSDDAGDGLTDGRGIQIASDGAFSGAANGSAAATTKNNYTSVTKVIVTYSTNKSAGAGTIAIKVNNVAYTGNASVTSTGGTSDRTIEYTPTTAQTGKVNISVSCTTNSIFIKSVQIYYTGAGTVYEQYRTACCNDPGFSFTDENDAPVTEYVIVREDLASASDAVEIDCNYTSSNSTGAITWYSTRRAAKTFPSTGAYTWTTPTAQPTNLNIDLANKKIAAKETGVWTIIISQADGGTTYCPVDAVVTVRVKTVDKFVDAVNGNFGGDAQRREDTGEGITLPTEAEFSIDDGCSTERRLLGWVKESDLSGYTSGYIDSWKTDDPATNKVIAPGTKVQATGITWYAVWGTEK
ncbi:MAG: InlB B-repeat-containing protein [Paludibacteraceae bacterium]|nr:InlB B-repeat-containing protein [Paludibacteraceae bacterium]